MAKFDKFFGWFQSKDWDQPSIKKSHQPVEVAPYRPLADFDTIIAGLKEVQADFDQMIFETDKVIKILTTPRPYTTRETDNLT